jgi:hypothetical protein
MGCLQKDLDRCFPSFKFPFFSFLSSIPNFSEFQFIPVVSRTRVFLHDFTLVEHDLVRETDEMWMAGLKNVQDRSTRSISFLLLVLALACKEIAPSSKV